MNEKVTIFLCLILYNVIITNKYLDIFYIAIIVFVDMNTHIFYNIIYTEYYYIVIKEIANFLSISLFIIIRFNSALLIIFVSQYK